MVESERVKDTKFLQYATRRGGDSRYIEKKLEENKELH